MRYKPVKQIEIDWVGRKKVPYKYVFRAGIGKYAKKQMHRRERHQQKQRLQKIITNGLSEENML